MATRVFIVSEHEGAVLTRTECSPCESNPKSHSEARLLLVLKYKHRMFLCMFINFIRDILFMVFMTTPENAEIDPVRANQSPSSMFSTVFPVTAASEMWENKPSFYQFLSEFRKPYIISNSSGFDVQAAVEVNGLY